MRPQFADDLIAPLLPPAAGPDQCRIFGYIPTRDGEVGSIERHRQSAPIHTDFKEPFMEFFQGQRVFESRCVIEGFLHGPPQSGHRHLHSAGSYGAYKSVSGEFFVGHPSGFGGPLPGEFSRPSHRSGRQCLSVAGILGHRNESLGNRAGPRRIHEHGRRSGYLLER